MKQRPGQEKVQIQTVIYKSVSADNKELVKIMDLDAAFRNTEPLRAEAKEGTQIRRIIVQSENQVMKT